jgi:drug/metabolite transporter (DMT)-like permease
MALGAAALSALYAYAYRQLSERGRAPATGAVTLLTFAIGSPALLAAASLFSTAAIPSISGVGTIAVFLGLGIVSTAIPTFGFSIASRRLPAIVTTTISLFVPLFAGLFAFLVLGERLSSNFAAGCLPILAGVALIVRQNRVRPGV